MHVASLKINLKKINSNCYVIFIFQQYNLFAWERVYETPLAIKSLHLFYMISFVTGVLTSVSAWKKCNGKF